MRENVDDFEFGNDFLDIIKKAWSLKGRINKLDFIKIRTLCSAKDIVKWENHRLGENISKIQIW